MEGQLTNPASLMGSHKPLFGAIQWGVLLFGLLLAAWLRPKGRQSQMQASPTTQPASPSSTGPNRDPGSLANAKLRPKPSPSGPLQLTGIRLDVAPHELLGIPSDASKPEIQRAYRELIKRYHPDRVGAPGSREWKDAEAIANALTQAKETLLSATKSRRSGQ